MLMARTGPVLSSVSMADLCQGDAWRLALPHYRNETLVFWLTRGEGRVVLDGARHGLAPDTVCVAPAGTLMMLELSPRALGQVLVLDGVHGALDVRVLRQIEPEAMAALTTLGRRDDGEPEDVVRWVASQTAPDTPRSQPSAGDRLVQAFCRRVTLDLPAQYSMAQHAAALAVTPTHLTRVCRTSLGMSAADVMTGRVLHAARTALSDTNAPIKMVAHDIGFTSAAYFTRFVQKHTGSTPTALRRRTSKG